MGDKKNDFLRLKGDEGFGEVVAGIGIEPGGGFVEEENGAVGCQSASKGNALPLTHAEFGATVEEATENGCFFLRKTVDNRLCSGKSQRSV